MRIRSALNRHAPRFLLTCAILSALTLSSVAPVAADDTTSYTALQIENWLEGTISGTVVTVENPPVVELTPGSQLLKVTNLSLEQRGITVGLSELRVTTNGSTTVHVVGELNVLGKLPRFSCDLEMEYLDGVNKLHVSDISSIVIAGIFTPSLSSGDIATIVDVLNKILDASELSVTSPGGDLTGIYVVSNGTDPELRTTWSSGSGTTHLASTETEIADKVGGMATRLANKATDYLAAVKATGQWA